MGLGKKIAMGLLAGVTMLALTAPQAEARNGRNAALIGGLILGAAAGAALAESANDNYDDSYQRQGWNRAAPRYQSYDDDQSYEPPVRERVQPGYSYGYGEGGNGDGCEHGRRYHQRAYYGSDSYDGY